ICIGDQQSVRLYDERIDPSDSRLPNSAVQIGRCPCLDLRRGIVSTRDLMDGRVINFEKSRFVADSKLAHMHSTFPSACLQLSIINKTGMCVDGLVLAESRRF